MEAGGAAALHDQERVLQQRRRLVSAAARGLTAGAAVTLALLAAWQSSKGGLVLCAFGTVFCGAMQMLLGEVLGGSQEGTAWGRALDAFFQIVAFVACGSALIAVAIVPTIGGQAAVLVVVAAEIGIIATAATAAQADSSAGILVLIGCGGALCVEYFTLTRMAT